HNMHPPVYSTNRRSSQTMPTRARCFYATGRGPEGNFMKKLIAIFAVLASLSLAVSPVATAQTNVDIDAVADSVSNADVDTLLNDLQTPPADDQLPDGFSDAEYANPDTATSEQ